MTAAPSSPADTLAQDASPTESARVVWCAPDGAAAAILRGLDLEAGIGDPDKLDTYRGAVAVVVPEDESAAAVMKAAVMARRLRDVAAKVCRAPITAEDFRHAAKAGADPKDWPAVAEAADLPPWTPEAAEADALAAEVRSAEDEALDLALASGREPTPAADEPEPWEPPIPLDGAAVLPEFPLDALPEHITGFVRELAASFEVHADMPAAFALGAGAAACQGKFRVHVRADYREPVNLFLAVALPPAELKSATIREVMAPVLAYEDELRERERANVEQARERHYVEVERRKELRSKAARGKKEHERAAATRELEGLAANPAEPPELPRLTAGADVLPEVLAKLLNHHDGRLTIYDAEGGTLFGNLAGRYQGGTPNFEILLKGHAGDDVQVDRQSKPPIIVRRPCLTVILAIQPDVVSRLADTPQFKERGLAGRFMFSFPQPTAGRRGLDGPPVSDTARALYALGIRAALDLQSDRGEDGREVARELTLTSDALEVYREVAVALMAQIRDGGELHGIPDWAGKAPGAAARVAGVLHVLEHSTHGNTFVTNVTSVTRRLNEERRPFLSSHENSSCSCGGRPESVPISAASVAHAWQIVTYYKAHALHAYSLMGADVDAEQARRILSWLCSTGLREFTQRECHRRFQSSTPKSSALDAPLSLLEDRHYIRRKPIPTRKPGQMGAPPKNAFTVNPLWNK